MKHSLTRLELQGFKSFAEPTVLDIRNRLTGIVGPNGSGKSNIVDALRWVLGERRAEQLRGDGAEQLIFAGSERRPRASLTRVAAVFKNESRFFPVDADEVTLERRASRAGASQMYLNGAELKLGDAAEILARARLGPRSFAIVGQGEADLFVRATPEERRAMIEELLGLNEFRIKKRRAERRLVKSALNMETVAAQLKELEPHLSFLRRQKKKWERRDAIADEFQTLAKRYFGGRLRFVEAERAEAGGEKELATALADEKENIRRLERNARAAEQELDAGSVPGRRASLRDIVSAVRAFLADVKRVLDEPDALASAVRAWIARFETLTEDKQTERKPALESFKEAVQELEAARSAERDRERGMQEAIFARERIALRAEELEREMQSFGMRRDEIFPADAVEFSPDDAEAMRMHLFRLQAQLAALGEIDEALMSEALETEERYAFLSRELKDLEESSENLRCLIHDLDSRIHDDFRRSFADINRSFASYFEMMFGGGKARLELTGGDDAPGVTLALTMPRKRAHGVEMLSGGERSLVSLAALFALISVSPPPFLALDEIDAALDEANAERFARLLGEFSSAAQFIVVTHNRVTIEAMQILYGITMENGVSRVLSLKV